MQKMQKPIFQFAVDTDLALMSADPLGFVLSEALDVTRECNVELPPGKMAAVRVEIVDVGTLETLPS